jgi:hypothetical protein
MVCVNCVIAVKVDCAASPCPGGGAGRAAVMVFVDVVAVVVDAVAWLEDV